MTLNLDEKRRTKEMLCLIAWVSCEIYNLLTQTDGEGYTNTYTNGWYTFSHDIRGSVMSIVNANGLVTNYVYDEFGNRMKTNGESDFLNETTYTGAIYDESTGLYYMNARYYNSETGQFISRDTYRGSAYTQWTQNLYTYTGNNPVNYTDPTGHSALALFGIALLGGAVNAGITAVSSLLVSGEVVWEDVGGAFVGGFVTT